MVWFTFTFLLGIPNHFQEENEKIIEELEEKLDVENDYSVVHVSKPNFSCHIEYVLLPNLEPIFIDVVSWDKAAKIYFENTSSAIQPKIIKKLRWIYFRVNHKLKLSVQDIRTLIEHNIKVTVSLGNEKFKELARSDSIKKFYFVNNNSLDKPEIFQPLYESLEDLKSFSSNKKGFSSTQQLFFLPETSMEASENVDVLCKNLMNLTNEYHDENLKKVYMQPIQEVSSGQNSEELDFDKTMERSQEKFNNSIEFFITGDELLSGKSIFQNCVKYNSQELPFVFNLIEVKNILTKFQADYFNPLSITLKHCKCFPVDELKKHGVTVVKFQYDVFNNISEESSTIPIDNVMKINFTKTFLTNNLDHTQLINYLQTVGLKINVLGNFEQEEFSCKKNVFDELAFKNNNNQIIGKRISENLTNYMVKLGTAFIDLSPILRQPHKLLCKCNFIIPFEKPVSTMGENQMFFLSNEFNPCYCKKQDFKIPIFLLSKALITVMIRMTNSLMKVYPSILMNPNAYNRLFTVIYDTKIAIPIIQIIQNENKEVLEPVNYCKNGLNLNRPLTKKHLGHVLHNDLNKKKRMTGFIVDCVNKIIIYVEGSQFGKIQQIWALISRAKPSEAHVLYDSTLVFTDRLYENFLKYGGFFKVTLEEDLEMALSRLKNCTKQDIPQLAFKAMNCLNQLIHCKSIKTAIQNNLFPDTDSLSNFALEFGIPIQFYRKPI